jgi:transposase-like protein
MPNTDLHTDLLRSYVGLGQMCRSHEAVDHNVMFVMKSGVTSNRVEGAWALFHRAFVGSFHKLSRKHLHRYLSEFDSRFNARREPINLFFGRVLQQANGRRLSRKALSSDA